MPKSEFADFSSHAQVPTAFALDKVIRIYYAARGKSGKSFTTFIDFDRHDPSKIIYHHKADVLGLGRPGTFDEDGVMPSAALQKGDRIWLYYSGWNQKVSTPYHNSTGLAESVDGGKTFSRVFEGPIVERNHLEPYVTVTPSILFENGVYRMWYVSGLKWIDIKGRREPVYVIMSAQSKDGIIWDREAKQIIPSLFEFEAFSRPSVFRKGKVLHMLFCSRGSEDYRNGSQGYKLGYAYSTDGKTWTRDSEALQVDPPTGEWEDKMNCYPYYIHVDGRDLVFYNGNGFGATGFGLAQLEGIEA